MKSKLLWNRLFSGGSILKPIIRNLFLVALPLQAFLFVILTLLSVGSFINEESLGDSAPIIGLLSGFWAGALAVLGTVIFAYIANIYDWQSKQARPWLFFTIGTGLWAIAEFTYALLEYNEVEPPFPSLADFPWLLAYIFFIGGLFIAERGFEISSAILPRVVYLLVIVLGSTGILWFLGGSLVTEDIIETAVGVSYPILDVVIIYIAGLIVLKFRQAKVARPWTVLILSFVMFALADLIYQIQVALNTYGNLVFEPVDAIFIISYSLLAFGGWMYARLMSEVSA
ncbi:MAG TPA: hypothetical protein VJ044_18185 [Candidatus Hodarchaeales archaeon]|nr:hypothetical protein [Candidatus Hodarchaeales archaeon]